MEKLELLEEILERIVREVKDTKLLKQAKTMLRDLQGGGKVW